MSGLISPERLWAVVLYDPVAGLFTWREKVARKVVVGSIAGCERSDGYVLLGIDGKTYYAHRLAWLYMIGAWPPEDIDHKIGKSNRWDNIRQCSRVVNMQNLRAPRQGNPTGLLGVSRHRAKFAARIRIGKRKIHLGTFDTPQEAHEAYKAAKRRHHEGCTI